MSQSQNRPAVIGVLGGMGPAATADFYRKIVLATPAHRDQDHLRTLVWSDPSIPDRTDAFLNCGESPIPALVAGATRLRDAGADFLAIPCNTAHLFLDAVRTAVEIPIIDMIDTTVTEIRAEPGAGHPVAVLGTRATLASGLYQRALRARGLISVEPVPAEQAAVSAAIAAVKSGDEPLGAQRLLPVLDSLTNRGVPTLVAACTELPLALARAQVRHEIRVVDPGLALARACVARALRGAARDPLSPPPVYTS